VLGELQDFPEDKQQFGIIYLQLQSQVNSYRNGGKNVVVNVKLWIV